MSARLPSRTYVQRQHGYGGRSPQSSSLELEIIETQEVGQFAGTDLVAFVAMFKWSVLARVAVARFRQGPVV